MRIRTTLAIVVALSLFAIAALLAMRTPDAVSVDQAATSGRVVVRGRIERIQRDGNERACAGWENAVTYGFAPHGFAVVDRTTCTTRDWENIWLKGDSTRLALDPALAALAARAFPEPRAWTPLGTWALEKGDCGPPAGWPTDPKPTSTEFQTDVKAQCLPAGAGVVVAACREKDKLVACNGARAWLPKDAPEHAPTVPAVGLLGAIAAAFAGLGVVEAAGRRRRALATNHGPYRQPNLPILPTPSAAPLAILFTAAAAAATAAIFLGLVAR